MVMNRDFKINNWRVIKVSDKPSLLAFFNPTLNALQHIKDNNNKIKIKIENTDSNMDGKTLFVLVDRVDNNSKNDYDDSKPLYTVFVNIDTNIPSRTGTFKIISQVETFDTPLPEETDNGTDCKQCNTENLKKPTENLKKPTENLTSSSKRYILIALLLFFSLLLLYFLLF
jgi:hypothetical protein